MKLGQLINIVMGNTFWDCFAKIDGLGPKSIPSQVY